MKLIELYVKNSLLLSKTNTEIRLDFRKCDKILNIIIGEMGSGKTALMGLMHPFATYGSLDSRNSASIFTPGKDGVKRTIFKHEGSYYTCEHTGKWVKDHHVIKSYFKIDDEEMNENGNHNTFKELVKLHLGIDQGFLTLLRLGSNVVNLIDKSATERKAYISTIVKDTEIYTMIFKALKEEHKNYNAQSTILMNKLQGLSAEKYDDFQDALIVYQNQLTKLDEEKNELLNQKFRYNAESRALLDGKSYNEARELLASYENSLMDLKDQIIDLENMINNLESTYTAEEIMKLLNDSRLQNEMNKAEIRRLDELHSQNSDILAKLEENLKLCQSDTNLKAMQQAFRELSEQIILYENELQGFHVKESSMILKGLVDSIDNLNQTIVDLGEYDSKLISKLYGSDSTILGYAKKQLEKINYRKFKIQSEMNNLKFSDTYTVSGVLFYPPFCPATKGGCPFAETHPATIQKKNRDKNIFNAKLEELEIQLGDLDNEVYRYTEYPAIYSMIQNFKKQWFTISNQLKDLGLLLIKNPLNILVDPTKKQWFDYDGLMRMISLAEKRERYYRIMERYDNIKAEIASLTKYDEEELKKEIAYYDQQINEQLNQILLLEEACKRYEDDIQKYDQMYLDLANIEAYKIQVNDLKKDETVLKDMIQKLKENIDTVRVYQEKFIFVNNDLSRVENEITSINDKIAKLNYIIRDIDYAKDELEVIMLNLKYYDLMIRAASSKEGIPLEYIKIFLGKTKDKINRLIDGVFEDDIEILDFVISETEFKIPYMINGNVVEDISSLSQGQTSIITLALSFALVDNVESPYNIFLLDEVDGALYEADRRKFLNILLNQIREVGIEQIFLTTHNRTFEGTPINVIMTTNEPVTEDRLTSVMKVFA